MAFGDDQALAREPIEQFAQCGDAGAVILLEIFELQLLAGRQPSKDDVGTYLTICPFSDGLVHCSFEVWGHQHHTFHKSSYGSNARPHPTVPASPSVGKYTYII